MRIWGLIGVIFVLLASSLAAAGTKPVLAVQSLTPFSVRGTHFEPSERITVTLNEVGSRGSRARLRAPALECASTNPG
jgi:hypothetical protein